MLLQVPNLCFPCLQSDMEEAKTQENRKLQQKLQELQLQSKETNDLLKREQEIAKEALEKAALVPEVQVDTTLVDKLTAENENLKVSMIDDFGVHCISMSINSCGKILSKPSG